MKHTITASLKQLLDHRRLMVVLIIFALLTIGVATYVIITTEASDLLVFTHYTAYGITHFYRRSWMYLLTFAAAVLLAFVIMTGIALKLLHQDREPLALLVGWVGVATVLMTLVTYIHITELT